jgi:phosphatidylglycerophosphatase C
MVTPKDERQGSAAEPPTHGSTDGATDRPPDDAPDDAKAASPGAPPVAAEPTPELPQHELPQMHAGTGDEPGPESPDDPPMTLSTPPPSPTEGLKLQSEPAPAGPRLDMPPFDLTSEPLSPELLPAELPGPEPLTEEEDTGRRVELLLAEAPDADPEAEQPERSASETAAPTAVAAEPVLDTPVDAPVLDVPVLDAPALDPLAPAAPRVRRNSMDRVGPIIAFDFDGTLTVRDSFTAFLKWREGSARYHAEMAALAPAALKYLFDRDPGKLKAAAVRRFLAGLPRSVLNAEAMEFATAVAPRLFRPDALKAWRRYRQDGARLIIVTASPENIVAPFARGLGADMLIGTQLLFDQDDRVQGGLLGDNCRGPVKVRRIKEALGEDTVLAAAYGDTDGDWEMLEMAEQQFMRLFVGVPGRPSGGN